jgi:hypothetical protein
MATLKKRINVSVSKDVEKMLKRLAKRDQVPQATKAEQLLSSALLLEEDMALDSIASERDTSRATFISHEEAWK